MSFPGRIALTLVALAVALIVAGAPAATAQPDEDPEAKKQAGKFLKAGDKLIRQGDYHRKKDRPDKAADKYQRALEAYQRAFDIYPKPQLYWLIALAEQRLERYLDALRHYQQLLREVEDINDALKQQVEINIEECKQHVATLTFKVEPEGATITVDGEDIGAAPYADPVFLAPGEHTVAVTAEGHTPFEDSVTLEAGAESERTITLEEIPVVVTKPKPKPKPAPKPLPPVSKTPLFIGLGATAALGATATVTGLIAVAKNGTFTDESKTQEERDAAADSGKTFALVTDILWLATIGAGAYTAYHYYMVYTPKVKRRERRMEDRRRAEKLWITPYAGRHAAGVAVGGRF
jgi:tetratricopeptide (TPR) repeat protein